MTLDPKFLAILGCPACFCTREDSDGRSYNTRPPLRAVGDTAVCDMCGRAYVVHDGIPVLLPEEAIMPDVPGASAPSAVVNME